MSPDYKKDPAPPANWQDFEDLCLSLWRPLLINAKKHGRLGQPQAGVDIFGQEPKTGRWIGIQCKQKGHWPPQNLTIAQIENEVRHAEDFKPSLSHFVIATSALRDAKAQAHVRELSESRHAAGRFTIDLYAWEDIQELQREQTSDRNRLWKIAAKVASATLALAIVAVATHSHFSRGEGFEVGVIDYQVESSTEGSLAHHLKVPLLAKEELTVVSAELRILSARSTQDIGILSGGQVTLKTVDIDQAVRPFRDANEMFTTLRYPVAPLRWNPQTVQAGEYFVLIYSTQSQGADYCIDLQFEVHPKGDLSQKDSWRSNPWVIRPLGMTVEIDPVQWRQELEVLPNDLEIVLGKEPYSRLTDPTDRAFYHAETTMLAWVGLLKAEQPEGPRWVLPFRDLLHRVAKSQSTFEMDDPRRAWAIRLQGLYQATLPRLVSSDFLSGDERLVLLRDADLEIQREVAKTARHAETLGLLRQSPDAEVRLAVAGNRHAPDAILLALAEDSDRTVRSVLLRNSAIPIVVVEKLLDDDDPDIQKLAQLRHQQLQRD